MPNNEFGDFQTPLDLAAQCLRVIGLPDNGRVLEPTCGLGSFLKASARLSPGSERVGLELSPEYAAVAANWGQVIVGNIFETMLTDAISWTTSGPLFVVGNPPWVTSAELNRMDSGNLPPKENFKGAKGLDALLGSSNFDVCEYIILKILNDFRTESLRLGMLCKTQVARNVIEYAARVGISVTGSAIYRINAKKWFGAAVDACWFVVAADPCGATDYTTSVFEDVFAPERERLNRFGVVNGLMVSDVDLYTSVWEADRACPYEWRSGLKHDASEVFELVAAPCPTTKRGEALNLEPEWVYPFLKSTDVFRDRVGKLTKYVIVPQKTFGSDTAELETLAPNLWAYLNANSAALDGRKSSIYRNRPRFSVFGHGDYTYAPYKVAVSGLHKEPEFRLIVPLDGRPVVLDDTCYFIPFYDGTEAALVTALLNSDASRALIESIVFWDSKRPITKKLLSRIDINRLPVEKKSVLDAGGRYADQRNLRFDRASAEGMLGSLAGPGKRPRACAINVAGQLALI